MELYEIEGFLRGKCLPGDLLVGESNAEYIFRQLKERDALAAENACLEQSIEEIADAFETGTDGALATAVDGAVSLSTPATDAVLKRIQAQGVEKFADECDSDSMLAEPEDTEHYLLMAEKAREFASKVRASKLEGDEQ